MYKFTNGIVVFDRETRDAYIKAGMKLEEKEIESPKKVDVFPNTKRDSETRSSTKENRKELRKKY